MKKEKELIKVEDLTTRFFTQQGTINAVSGVNFDINSKEVLCIVGESGSGKSVTGKSIVNLVDTPGKITRGEVWYYAPELARISKREATDGEYINLLSVSSRTQQLLLGTEIGIISQDPGASFNPSLTVGRQIAEVVEMNERLNNSGKYTNLDFIKDLFVPGREFVSEESKKQSVSLLESVDIPDPASRADEYPNQFSGGMLQRAMIAQAIASNPRFLIADEPTTGLDVTIQAGILNLLKEIQSNNDMSILLITHDLGVVSQIADKAAVMYGGEILELGPTKRVINHPENPYTQGLINSLPNSVDNNGKIEPINGTVPNLIDSDMPKGCPFSDRCPEVTEECINHKPPTKLVKKNSNHHVTCFHAGSDQHIIDESSKGNNK